MKSRIRYLLNVSIVCFALTVLALPVVAETPTGTYGAEFTVCAMAGCWMEIADSTGHEIRIKVEDGVIVFPMEAVGANAAAQGTVKVQEMSRDEYVDWQRHLADETGEDFDESSIGDGPYQLVQIAGSGARIGG